MKGGTKKSFGMFRRISRFLQKPWPEKVNCIKSRLDGLAARMPVPVRLPFGAWWIQRNDNLGESLRTGRFENEELAFVARFLQPGMTVIDIGAHHGLYTLLASKRVGSSGRIFSFEPSPRERRALRLHLALNVCRNVKVQGLAVGIGETEATLHVVQGSQTGCNSLRPPEVLSSTSAIRVRVTSLDVWLKLNAISRVDFIKLDVEGAELEVLKGAQRLLGSRPRPVILAEVQDVRTAPWGYRAKAIIDYLSAKEYRWLRLLPGNVMADLDVSPPDFEGNFVACPEESLAAMGGTVGLISDAAKHMATT